jgi:ferredoxin-NADP reductase
MWTAVTLTPRHRITPDAVEIAIHPRFGTIHFRSGQFIVLEVPLADGVRRSAFSIVRREQKGIIIGVKKNGQHGISAWLNALQQPTKASMAGPFGNFQVNPSAQRHIFITGGSGITPVRSMFDDLLARGVKPVLVYANQSPEKAMYLQSFRLLAEADGIHLIEVYDRDISKALNQVDLTGAACYTCGPSGLITNALDTLEARGVPASSIQTELYGLDMDGTLEASGSYQWKDFWRPALTISMEGQKSMLNGALAQNVNLPHACGIGVCGTCKARLLQGEAICGTEKHKAGDEILTCISKPIGPSDTILAPAKGGRAQIVAVCLLIGVFFLGSWWVPPAQGFKALGPMNTSHENLECNACHKEAPGTFRQQVRHNAQSFMGLHNQGLVPVGLAPVDNKTCINCHKRPNDRHPTSRFLETQFAEQRRTLGPHECNNCHGEHQGKRVAQVQTGFCIHCHQDLEVNFDNIQPSHAELLETEAWETCLQCHDFHGNHIREIPINLKNGISQETVLRYLEGGNDPYSTEKTFTANQD